MSYGKLEPQLSKNLFCVFAIETRQSYYKVLFISTVEKSLGGCPAWAFQRMNLVFLLCLPFSTYIILSQTLKHFVFNYLFVKCSNLSRLVPPKATLFMHRYSLGRWRKCFYSSKKNAYFSKETPPTNQVGLCFSR